MGQRMRTTRNRMATIGEVKAAMLKRLRQQKGQSILEYLVIVATVIAAIFLVKNAVQTNMNGLFTSAADQTSKATAALNGITLEIPGQ